MVKFIQSKQVSNLEMCLEMCMNTMMAVLQSGVEPTTTHFLLSDGVYATAEIPPTDKVMLWLGVSSLK